MYIPIPDNFISTLLHQTLIVINQLTLPVLNKIENHPVIFTLSTIDLIFGTFLILKTKIRLNQKILAF